MWAPRVAMEDGQNWSHHFNSKLFEFNHKPTTSLPSSSLPPTNTGGRLDSFNWALLSSSISSSSTSLRTSGSKVGKFSRFLRTSLLGDACNSGLIYVNDFSNCLSSGSFLMYSPIEM